MIKRRLWLFDVTGTLLSASGRGFDYRLPKRLGQLMKMGNMVGICTSHELENAKVVHAVFDLNGPVIAKRGGRWWWSGMMMGAEGREEELEARDKGEAVTAICDRMEIPLSAVCYVGDSWNDWPAFEQTLVGGGRAIYVGGDSALAAQLVSVQGEVVPAGTGGLAKWLTEEV